MLLETVTTWVISFFIYLILQISLNTVLAFAIFVGFFRNVRVLHLILAAALYKARD